MGITGMNIAICEALGLNPHLIRRSGVKITLDSELGPIVEVQYKTMDESVANNFVGALVRYKLVDLGVVDLDDEENT